MFLQMLDKSLGLYLSMPSLQRVLFILVARMIVPCFVNCRMVFDMPREVQSRGTRSQH